MNYGQSKGLVQVSEANTYQGNDPYVLGKPLAIEFNPNAFDDQPDGDIPNDDSPRIVEEHELKIPPQQ